MPLHKHLYVKFQQVTIVIVVQ